MTRAYNTATTQQNSGGAVAGVTAGKNPVLNSAFNVWQRGTSIAPTGSTIYTADRWTAYNSNMTVSRQVTGDTTNLPNIQYCARVQRTAGNTGTGTLYFFNPFETSNSIAYVGKTITFSFYARAGANYSPTSNALVCRVSTGTGTDQNPLTVYTGLADAIATTVTLTTTWQRFTATATLPTNATELFVGFQFNPTGTAGANDYFEVTGVQLEVGSVATPYAPYSPTYQGELAACQRYYWRTTTTSTGLIFATGISEDATRNWTPVYNPVPMRVASTSVDFSALNVSDAVSFTSAVSGVNISVAGTNINRCSFVTTGQTAKQSVHILSQSGGGYLGFSAEL